MSTLTLEHDSKVAVNFHGDDHTFDSEKEMKRLTKSLGVRFSYLQMDTASTMLSNLYTSRFSPEAPICTMSRTKVKGRPQLTLHCRDAGDKKGHGILNRFKNSAAWPGIVKDYKKDFPAYVKNSDTLLVNILRDDVYDEYRQPWMQDIAKVLVDASNLGAQVKLRCDDISWEVDFADETKGNRWWVGAVRQEKDSVRGNEWTISWDPSHISLR